MKGSPLVFLVVAIACFSAGVVLFTHSSKQNPVTSAIIVVMTLVASSGLISISGWFVLERWTFLMQKEQKRLGEVISETLDQLAELGIVRAHRCAMQWCSQRLASIRAYLTRFLDWLTTSRTSKTKPKNDAMTVAAQVGMAGHLRMPSTSSEGPGSSDSHKKRHDILDARNPLVRFQNAVRAVIELQRTTGKRAKPIRPGLPRRDSWWQTSMSSGSETSTSPVPDPGLSALRGD
ncbi:hypothetical protein JVT61DRAFT_9049 [Boletus reticuloceps]|uniref:Uncharacterized protein n=1 Tax=Boletus reticuloceps TaxID=495285 RepID=A0A8I3A6P4_9AGAM|nr:hypothetical protein JVT61DRAFT_9049 [Boletus reticuloceps]